MEDVQADLGRYVDRVEQQHERIAIIRGGRRAAVLITVGDLAALEDTLAVLGDPEAARELAAADRAWDWGEYTEGDTMAALLRERARREPRRPSGNRS